MGKASFKATLSPKDDDEVPPHMWAILHQLLLGVTMEGDKKLDLRVPHPKKSLEGLTTYIFVAYGFLFVYGLLSNVILFIYIIKNKLYKECTHAFILNNVISDIYKCVVVLPISLYVLIIHNWVLGELLCNFLPMMQDLPFHVTTLTYVCLAWDRYRYARKPNNPRLPAIICTVGSWLTSVCFVLPYPIYILHLDLGAHFPGPEFKGVGMCIVNLTDDIKEYLRGIFIMAYTGPLAIISYYFFRTSKELTRHNAPAAIYYGLRPRNRNSRCRIDSNSTAATADVRSTRVENDHNNSPENTRDCESARARLEGSRARLNVANERRTQKYLGALIAMYAVCILPLMVMKLARLVLAETYENSKNFDYAYLVFVWIAFLPICLTPPIFACWKMCGSSGERIKGFYFFGHRKPRQSCDTVVTNTDTPAIQMNCLSDLHQQLDDGCSDGACSVQQESHAS